MTEPIDNAEETNNVRVPPHERNKYFKILHDQLEQSGITKFYANLHQKKKIRATISASGFPGYPDVVQYVVQTDEGEISFTYPPTKGSPPPAYREKILDQPTYNKLRELGFFNQFCPPQVIDNRSTS